MDKIKSAKPGQPLPYDPKMGITESEYNEISNSSKYMKLFKQNDGEMVINWKNENICMIKISGLENLTQFSIDLNKNVIQTEFGELNFSKASKIENENALIGKWEGYVWNLEQSNVDIETFDFSKITNETNIRIISLTFGLIDGTSKIFIYFRANGIEQKQRYKVEEIIEFSLD